MRVLFLTNVPSPYRVNFFNELGKKCDLTVIFEKSFSDERDASWKNYKFNNFKGIILRGFKYATDSAFCPSVVKYLNVKYFDHIVICNFSSPTGMLAILYLRVHKKEYYLESDGGFAKNGKGVKENLKKFFISGAKGYFSTSREHDKYYLTYGADRDKLIRYPFTSLCEEDLLNALNITKNDKVILRSKLGIVESKVIISVGRFSYCAGYGKGYDTILSIAEKMDSDVGFYIIGDNPTEEFLEWKKVKNLAC